LLREFLDEVFGGAGLDGAGGGVFVDEEAGEGVSVSVVVGAWCGDEQE
jgi:hypothetical protein